MSERARREINLGVEDIKKYLATSPGGGPIATGLGSIFTTLLGMSRYALYGGNSPAKGGGQKNVEYIGEDKTIDPDTAAAFKRLADAMAPGKRYSEILKDYSNKSNMSSFDESFKEAVRGTPPATKVEKTSSERKTGSSPKPQEKRAQKPVERRAEGKGTPPPKGGEGEPPAKIAEEIPVEGPMAVREYGETEAKKQTQEEWQPSTYDDYFEEATTPPPSDKDIEERERWERLDEFVNQITGRKD